MTDAELLRYARIAAGAVAVLRVLRKDPGFADAVIELPPWANGIAIFAGAGFMGEGMAPRKSA